MDGRSLDDLDSQSAQIVCTSKCGESIRIASSISQVNGVLGELNIILPPQHSIWCRIDLIQVGVIQGKLHPNKFYAWSAAGIGRAVLNWEENGGISGSHGIVDNITVPAEPR